MKNPILIIVILFFFTFLFSSAYAESVPEWVKNTAGWWATDAISETEFVNAIEFLIKDELIQVSISETTKNSNGVPEWVKNTAGWWATDAISEKEFIRSIEFLIESGLISLTNLNCNPNEDKNKNQIPDEIENGSSTSLFKNEDWSNCIFPIDLSYYIFENVNFTNADFSNSNLFNTQFDSSTFVGTDFSNNILQGVSFFDSDLINVNFDNTDFTANTWEQPFIYFTYSFNSDNSAVKVDFSCYFAPCEIATAQDNALNDFYKLTFDGNNFPLNFAYVDLIIDESDNHSVWRHISDFTNSRIENSNFQNSNLSHVQFYGTKIVDVDFSKSNMHNARIIFSDLSNVKFEEKTYNDTYVDSLFVEEERIFDPKHIDLDVENFPNPKNFDLEIKFIDALDEIPINWSMGLDIFQETLYVADTDNHRILEYDVNTFEKSSSFSSPFQNYCAGVNAFTSEKENCDTSLRNLPTSTVILDDKLFVAYGFQNEIQVFDIIEKTFLFKFGSIGDDESEFNDAYKISASSNNLFVADSKNHRIQTFDSNGNFVNQFTTNIDSIVDSSPYDLKIFQNEIFILDNKNSSILVFDLQGNFKKKISVDEINSKTFLTGLDVHENLIMMTDSGNDLIIILDLDGNLIMKFGNTGSYYGQFISPYDIVYDGKHIFISDNYNYRIQIFELFS